MEKERKSVKVLVTLDGGTADRIKEQAVQEDRSVSYIVARYAREGVEKRVKK